jgi:hypothetical protein
MLAETENNKVALKTASNPEIVTVRVVKLIETFFQINVKNLQLRS